MAGNVTLPNLITIGRILLVPAVVWLMAERRFDLAFVGFVVAGLSDAADGLIARHWNLRSRLGAFLDPLADKLLLVSTYVTLGFLGLLPDWLVILVVARDVLIIGGVLLGWVLGAATEPHPSVASKANTFSQIVLAAVVLFAAGRGIDVDTAAFVLIVLTAVLTTVSGGAYLRDWLDAMSRHAGTRRGDGREP
jgi:cardiolipin synthase